MIAMLLGMELPQQLRQILPKILGKDWSIVACQALGVDSRELYHWFNGTRPMPYRKVRILETYLAQRHRARSQRRARRLAALEREIQAEEMAAESGSQRLTAYVAERKRQGTI